MSNDQYFHPNSANKIEETVGGYEKQHVSRETAPWVVVNVDFIDGVKVQMNFFFSWMEITTKSRVPFGRGVLRNARALMWSESDEDNLIYLHVWHFIDHSHHRKPSAVSPLIILTWDILLMHPLHQLFLQTSYCSWFRPSAQRLPMVTHAGCPP